MDTLLDFVLELYRVAQDTPVTEFQDLAFEMLKAKVAFRGATWSNAHFTPELQFLSAHLHNEPPAMLADFVSMNQKHRRLVAWTGRHPGRAAAYYAPAFLSRPEEAPMRAYIKRYGHERNLMIADPTRTQWISCFRTEGDDHFTERDCSILTALMPHLVQALAINRSLCVGDRLVQGRSPQVSARALIDRNGVFLHCGKRFLELMREEWRDWSETRIPAALLSRLQGSEKAQVAEGRVEITAQSFDDATLLTAREVSCLDRLSPRELAVAREFGLGRSYKTIARDAQLAPATVRNMLQNAYRKLGIDNKAALARLFELEHR